jgi:hypothetical protein
MTEAKSRVFNEVPCMTTLTPILCSENIFYLYFYGNGRNYVGVGTDVTTRCPEELWGSNSAPQLICTGVGRGGLLADLISSPHTPS